MWGDWRGPGRLGRVLSLPKALPAKPALAWGVPLSSRGLGGVAATADRVIVSDRELNDTTDAYRCLSAADGKTIWTVRTAAPGQLDYGNSPRATPVVGGDRVYLHGAFGHLTCADLATGKVVWELNIRDEFEPTDERKWGTCSTPLLVDGKLIVNPGAKDASLAALDPDTGKTVWTCPGKPAGYGSLIAGTFGGVRQVVGHDADSLGGWDPATGRRLWRLVPDRPNDFNVPTPVPVGDKLLVSTENNGTRLYAFAPGGPIVPKPVAVHRRLAPDTHTPVVTAGRVFGVWRRLYCLDAGAGLREVWDADDPGFTRYCTAVASEDRVLIVTLGGELILLAAEADRFDPLARVKLFDGEGGVYSHPAFARDRVYVRGGTSVVCVRW